MVPVLIDVRSISEEVGAMIDIADGLDLGELRVGDEVFVLHEPAPYSVTITNAGGGIVAHGHIHADVTATCSRCLCEFDDAIDGEVVGFYVRPGDERDGEEEPETVDTDGCIDIGPALLAALVIEAPFAPLHDEECRGLCPTCGADLNEGACECHNPVADAHPLAGLKVLLGDSDPKSDEDP